MGDTKGTIGSIRIVKEAYYIAKKRAKEECISMSQWVSKAIMEKALLDDLSENKDDDCN